MPVIIAESREEIERCYDIIRQLRPHLSLIQFVEQVSRQQKSVGYTIAYFEEDGNVRAVIGYRISEYLAWGKVLFIDDLVTDEKVRGKRFGGALLDWTIETGKALECKEIHLESGVQRFEAHRFYLAKKMHITCHHFALKLTLP